MSDDPKPAPPASGETPDRFRPNDSPDPIEHFWTALERGWDIEPRAYFEKEAVQMGFKSPVEMAVHWMWKRNTKRPALPPDTPDALEELRCDMWAFVAQTDDGPSSSAVELFATQLEAALALSRGQTPEPQVVYPADFKPGAPRRQGLWVESAPPAEEPRRPEPPKKV